MNLLLRIVRHCSSTALIGASCISVSVFAATDEGAPISPMELTDSHYMFPTDLVPNANEIQQANYAWRLFIAANNLTNATLTNGSGREKPVQSFISTGEQNLFSSPTVFESFYHRAEAYPYYTSTQPSSPIDRPPAYYYQPIAPGNQDANCPPDNQEAYCPKSQQYVNLDENNQIGQNFLYYRHSNAPDFPMLYMAKVNSTEVNYVQGKAKPSTQSTFAFPDGVIEIKAAWRRVKDIRNSDPASYHQAMASYYVAGKEGDTPTVVTEPFALVALHIIQKTANYPQFIFTTFEHVDAVTRDSNGTIIDPAYKWTSQNLRYGPDDPTQAVPLGAYDVNEPGLPTSANVMTSYTLPPTGPLSQDYITVTQPKTILQETNEVNNQVLAMIQSLDKNSVWANYRLKGVQTIPTSNESSPDFYLANIVVESSQPGVQLFRGNISGAGRETFCNFREHEPAEFKNSKTVDPNTGIMEGCTVTQEQPATTSNNITTTPLVAGEEVPTANVDGGGCQGCHGVAQTTLGGDFSFLVTAAGGAGFEVDSEAAAGMSEKALQEHLNAVIRHRDALFDYQPIMQSPIEK